MNDEQLPDGLQLAIRYCSIGTSEDRRNFIADAVRSEHAQRLTLQHHAADQAQRSADLEAERDELRARLAEIEAAIEALVDRCNNDASLTNDDAVIAAEAVLERLYQSRAAAPEAAR